MAELEQASQKVGEQQTDEQTDQTDSAGTEPARGYEQFSAPQRVVLQTLDTVNKPFAFVPQDTNDTLGIVAVITLMVSMVATAMFLLMK